MQLETSQMVKCFSRSACFVDNNKGKCEEYKSVLKIDGGKADEICSKKKKILDHSYGSFKGFKEDRHDFDDKNREKNLKSGIAQLLHAVNQKGIYFVLQQDI